MHAVTLKLTRWWWPPWSRKVAVGAITVRGFMALVGAAATHAAAVRLRSQRDIAGEDLIRTLGREDWALFADLLCHDEAPGFFGEWFTERNVRALLDASARANRWERLLACLNLNPKVPPRMGSLIDDVVAVCKTIPGQSVEGLLAMPMETFLDMVDSLNREALSMDPTADPEAVASEGGDLLTVPGLAVVH